MVVLRPRAMLVVLVRLRGGLVMRHKPILDNQIAYTAGVIGLGLLPVAMVAAALLLR
jgi:hypothetical protein